MKPFICELQLYGYLNSPRYITDSSHLLGIPTLKILTNVRSPINVKKDNIEYKSVKTLSALQIPKIKCNCVDIVSLYVDSFTSTIIL